jgi:hypothetical protein
MVGGLAAQLGDRPACDCFALAPSRLVADLGIWLTWPVAWRTHEGRPRDPCPYRSNEPREFSVGRAADPWGTAQTRLRRVAGHGVPLHATAELSDRPELAHLPAEPGTWDRYDRSWRRRSDIRPASYSRPQVDRAGCRVRHHQDAGWHLLRAYRATVDLATVEAISLFQ